VDLMDKYSLFWSALFAFCFVGNLLTATDSYITHSVSYLTLLSFSLAFACLLASMYNMVKAVKPKGSANE